MFKIIKKESLAVNLKRMEILAHSIAMNAKPGQFLILRVSEKGERIPLTIAGSDKASGLITIIFQEIGKTTIELGKLNEGDNILDVLGPLGHPTEIKKIGTIVMISGGVGTAEALPVAKAFKDAGNKVIGIVGARDRELLILEDEMRKNCDDLIIMTDNGSIGRKGLVTNALETLITKESLINLVYAIGPVPMMKAVANMTDIHKIKTLVSLNPIMVDGTGMCGSCRVSIEGKVKFACVDGPEFDAHTVNWNEISSRLNLFKGKEKEIKDIQTQECKCKCQKG